MADHVLSLENVAKTFNPGRPNEVTVFRDLNIEVAQGEVVGLISPSGSGKSTLLNIAGLLDRPTSGKVFIDGVDMSQADDGARTRARRDKIGFVFQFHYLLAEFSALENVMIPAQGTQKAPSEIKARAEALLARLGMSERMNHRPTSLSGGEQQRVAICRAIINSPALLLADEPTGNLDPANSERVFEMFIELAREENQAALVATHNLDLAAKMDRVIDLRALLEAGA